MTAAPSAGMPLAAVLAGTTSPSATGTATGTPKPEPGPDPDLVTPGTLGFVVVFLLAIATWLLLRNMTGHLRRMKLREEEAARRQPDDVRPEGPQPPTPQPPTPQPPRGS